MDFADASHRHAAKITKMMVLRITLERYRLEAGIRKGGFQSPICFPTFPTRQRKGEKSLPWDMASHVPTVVCDITDRRFALSPPHGLTCR
jgi:hypothetical protein